MYTFFIIDYLLILVLKIMLRKNTLLNIKMRLYMQGKIFDYVKLNITLWLVFLHN